MRQMTRKARKERIGSSARGLGRKSERTSERTMGGHIRGGRVALWRGAVAVLALSSVSAPAPAALTAAPLIQEVQEFRWSGRVEPGRSVEIKNVNGAVRAERASGSEVEVVARKTGRRSDPASVSVEVIPHAGGVTVCALHPTPAGQRANECAPGSGGRMSVRDNDVQVEFTVRVPDGVRLVARTTNGAIAVSGLTADVDANTTNGAVRISTLGVARARSTNGGIDVTMGSGAAAGTGDLEFRTTNGAITVTVVGELHADVRATTTNGALSSDFPVTVQGTFGPRRMEGTIGNGGRALVLQTTNGDIRLRRAGG